MKTDSIKYFVLGLLLILTVSVFAQGGPPPPPDNTHGSGNDFSYGGGAPIGSGIGILLALGAAYGGRKLYRYYKDYNVLED